MRSLWMMRSILLMVRAYARSRSASMKAESMFCSARRPLAFVSASERVIATPLAPGLLECLGLVMGGKLVDNLVDIPLKDLREPVQGKVYPVVGDAALGEVVGADPLAPVSGTH